jgi:hypothetical protein
MLNALFCKIVGHKLKKAGSCPFTGKTYDFCVRCTKMIEVNPKSDII